VGGDVGVIRCPPIRVRMLHDARTATALALVLAVASPCLGGPQEVPATAGVGGSWEGWAKLTNDWPGASCRYESGPESTSVHLELSPGTGGSLKGSAAIDLAATPDSGCPALRERYVIEEVTVGEDTVSFTDSGGNEWTLSLRRGGSVLQGLLAWRSGGPDRPLAEGFALPDGTRPLARLSGEVRLHRAGETEAPAGQGAGAAAAASAATPAKGGAGHYLGTIGIILGANAVGLGLLYGVNEAGKGSSQQGVITCSPRVCIVGAPGAPCFCQGNVVSGASCGTTSAGAQIGAPCDGVAVPCESALSCNSGVCEDRFGRCPY
jgi:hypothetical protein